eukprot:5278425-Prymnesium_polylepis.1
MVLPAPPGCSRAASILASSGASIPWTRRRARARSSSTSGATSTISSSWRRTPSDEHSLYARFTRDLTDRWDVEDEGE